MKNIIISNQQDFEKKKEQIIKEGIDNFHVIADFDRTLTTAFIDGQKTPSIISELRNGDYLTEEYAKKAHDLFDKYHPMEIDPNLSEEEKKKAMNKWWTEHFNLLIKSGLNKKDLKKIIKEDKTQFRKGVLEFFDFLYNKKIPLIIMSSSGIGDVIPMYLKKVGKMFDNIYLINNQYEWNEKKFAINIKKPIIHSMNKDETTLEKLPIYSELKNRKNVLLLGDGLGDLGMIKGFDYNNLINMGFLNYNVETSLEKFKKGFDVILLNNQDFNYINQFVKEIR